MKTDFLDEFRRMLTLLRCTDPLLNDFARDQNASCYGRLLGFIDALEMARLIDYDDFSRMEVLVFNVVRHCGRPFPDASNAGPVMPSGVAIERCPKAREVIANASNEVPPPDTRAGLRLLCLLVPARTGENQSLPIHTLHRMPPYASRHRSYRDEKGRWSVALDILDLPGGTGFYLRETHARAPSPEVLARYLRQRQAHALCADSPAIRVGGLNRVH